MRIQVTAKHVEAALDRYRKLDASPQLPIYLTVEAVDAFNRAEGITPHDALYVGLLAARNAYRSR